MKKHKNQQKKPSKSYNERVALVDRDKSYPPQEALQLVKETARTVFDETVELHMRTGSDPRQADQLIRGVVTLPHGLGREIRVLVFATGEGASAAREAGADFVGTDDLIERIEGGWVEFDTAIATPDIMGRLGRLGRVLGRRGLMPNPRTGTVVQSEDLSKTVEEAKKGRLEYRMDRTALIHSVIGKASFTPEQLLENMSVLVGSIVRQRPSSVKGQFIVSAFLTTTMGPSIRLDVPTTLSLGVE